MFLKKLNLDIHLVVFLLLTFFHQINSITIPKRAQKKELNGPYCKAYLIHQQDSGITSMTSGRKHLVEQFTSMVCSGLLASQLLTNRIWSSSNILWCPFLFISFWCRATPVITYSRTEQDFICLHSIWMYGRTHLLSLGFSALQDYFFVTLALSRAGSLAPKYFINKYLPFAFTLHRWDTGIFVTSRERRENRFLN